MRGVVVVGVGGVGVGIDCEGFEVELAGGGEDAGCYFASGSGWVSLMGFGKKVEVFLFGDPSG